MTVFSIMHFANPGHFRDIMIAASFPMVDVNVYAASLTELIAGVLLLSGLFTRVGGLLGVATMVPAVYATFKLASLTAQNLPGGLEEVPFVPPLPLPIVVIVASIAAIILGGGGISLDRRMTAASCDLDTE